MLYASAADRGLSRRRALGVCGGALLSICTQGCARDSYALKPGTPSKSKLLERTQSELTPEEQAAEKERIAEEKRQRLERQKELQATAERRKAGLEEESNQADLEANLRASYYYPLARKRYLPRVRRAFELLPRADALVDNGDWGGVSELATGSLADAVLPMQLYASSLGGQGLSLAPKFVQKMDEAATRYEKACKNLQMAVKKKDERRAHDSVRDMQACVKTYRAEGKLEAEDFGIGEVPKNGRVGSGFGNNNPALYNRNFSSILDE